MTIDKLPSGNYRVRLQINGKRYTKILDHEPKKSELERLFAGKIDLSSSPTSVTFSVAFKNYMEDKSNTLSLTTQRGYNASYDRLSPIIKVKKLDSIDTKMVQREVNDLTSKYSYKSIKHSVDLVKTILAYYDINTKISPTLPQKPKDEPYIPSEDDIQIILKEVKGSMFEIPIKLACYGLRLGEICALTVDDIKGNKVTINKAQIIHKGKKITKAPKTSLSNRTIEISPALAKRIKEQGYVYEGAQGSISNKLKHIQIDKGMNRFSIHKFRHYFCSKCIDMGLDFVTIQRLGGWSNLDTIQKIYAHRMRAKEKDNLVATEIGKIIAD